jgi:hypothetical protein
MADDLKVAPEVGIILPAEVPSFVLPIPERAAACGAASNAEC